MYGVTRGLHARFGAGRVFDTLLDETSILGLALGAAVSGFLPIPEIQYLAYLHNAEDQLRGEAATLQFFSQGRYRNGMVIRIAGYGYQRGFGGHFHNDDAVGVLRDIPGLVIASPSRPDDAAAMLATCAASALVDGSVCVFLEPIALYQTRDLLEEGDEGWVASSDRRARTRRVGTDVRGWSRSHDRHLGERPLSLGARRAHARRPGSRGPRARPTLARSASGGGHPARGGDDRAVSSSSTRRDARAACPRASWRPWSTQGFDGRLARVASKDSFVPLGDAARLVLVSEDEIEAAALALAR